MEPEGLFSRGDLHSVLEANLRKVDNVAGGLPKQEFLTASTDALVGKIVSELTVAPLDVDINSRTTAAHEGLVKPSAFYSDPFKRSSKGVVGTKLTVDVPFIGDPLLFDLRPSASSSLVPRARVIKDGQNTGRLQFAFEQAQGVPPDLIKQEVERQLALLSSCVSNQRTQVDAHNAALPSRARAAVEARRARLLEQQQLVEALGKSARNDPTERSDKRLQAAAILSKLYLATTNPAVSGIAFRHALKELAETTGARRELAEALMPELATRQGSVNDDYFQPTLACLLKGLPAVEPVITGTIAFLRDKYERDGDFRVFTWEQLTAFLAMRAIPMPFDRDQAIQLLAVARLSSGWYGEHWSAPRILEELLDVGDAAELVRRSLSGTAAQDSPRTITGMKIAGDRKIPDKTEVRISNVGHADKVQVHVRLPWQQESKDLGLVPIVDNEIVLPLKLAFLCHAKEDKKQVEEVGSNLLSDGLLTWYDEKDLLPGDEWERVIEAEVENCDFFLAFLSSRSVAKTGYVQRELRYALEQHQRRPLGSRFIVPILLDDCAVPRELGAFQFLRLWEEGAYQRLILALK